MKSKNLIVNISRYILAVLFIFSGAAKGLNPFGLSIQFGEYFSAMGVAFLSLASSVFAVLLPAVETLVGLMLLLRLAPKLATWAVTLFMSFFTLLTLWITLYNPVSDCGCFGDLLKISNWETFGKNVFFMLPTVILFLNRNEESQKVRFAGIKWTVAIALSFLLPLYSTANLPLVDATPFKIGVNIPQAMEVPEGASQGEQTTVLLYKNLKTGKTQEFQISDTTWYDSSTWEFVDSKTTTITEGYKAPITSFPMLTNVGEDIHKQIFESSPNLLIVATNNPELVDWAKIEQLATAKGLRTILLTSVNLATIPENIEAYNSDFSLIRTMIQYPTGGALLLHNGTITQKWILPNIPTNY